MKSIYTYKNDKKKILISFELDDKEKQESLRDNMAYDYLVDLLKIKYEEIRDDFYLDDVQEIKIKSYS